MVGMLSSELLLEWCRRNVVVVVVVVIAISWVISLLFLYLAVAALYRPLLIIPATKWNGKSSYLGAPGAGISRVPLVTQRVVLQNVRVVHTFENFLGVEGTGGNSGAIGSFPGGAGLGCRRKAVGVSRREVREVGRR